jgi:hypothetical protein
MTRKLKCQLQVRQAVASLKKINSDKKKTGKEIPMKSSALGYHKGHKMESKLKNYVTIATVVATYW